MWPSTDLPTQAYVFLRRNPNNGLYDNKVCYYDNLKVVYSSHVYHVLCIPAVDYDDPVIIVLLNANRSIMIPIQMSVEVPKACIRRTAWDQTLVDFREDKFVALTVTDKDDKSTTPVYFDELMAHMMIHVTETVGDWDFEKSFKIDELTELPVERFQRRRNPETKITVKEVLNHVKRTIDKYAFIKHVDNKAVGLVTSMNRLKYYKTATKLADNPDHCLLDEIRHRVDQFIVLNSPNLPGHFMPSEKTILLEANHNVLDNLKIFLAILQSAE